MQNHKNLNIWKEGLSIVVNTYAITKTFPSHEKYGLKSQMQRAAVSIPSNIAEGCGREGNKQLKYFLSISLGSSYELETQLILAEKLGFCKKKEVKVALEKIVILQRMISSFINRLK